VGSARLAQSATTIAIRMIVGGVELTEPTRAYRDFLGGGRGGRTVAVMLGWIGPHDVGVVDRVGAESIATESTA